MVFKKTVLNICMDKKQIRTKSKTKLVSSTSKKRFQCTQQSQHYMKCTKISLIYSPLSHSYEIKTVDAQYRADAQYTNSCYNNADMERSNCSRHRHCSSRCFIMFCRQNTATVNKQTIITTYKTEDYYYCHNRRPTTVLSWERGQSSQPHGVVSWRIWMWQ